MDNEEFDFETEMTEEDKNINDTMDRIITIWKKEMENDGEKVSILAPAKMQKVFKTYKDMKHMTKDAKDVRVLCEVNEPFISIGSVSVIGKNIVFNNPELFMQAVRSANNFEVYPKNDGTVQMNFTFHGLTMVIGKESK